MNIISKIQGSLIGGAIGDALGYPVEFDYLTSIKDKYGVEGITEPNLVNGVAVVSDDTQMTMFTAEGLTKCKDREYLKSIRSSYINWYLTQTLSYYDVYNDKELLGDSELLEIKELYRKRAPGETCMNSIYHGCDGTIYNHINNSKGCGGVMRVAPIGLAFSPDKTGKLFINRLGAEAAALTHGHPLGYMSAFVLVSIINDLVNTNIGIEEAVNNSLSALRYEFGDNKEIEELENKLKLACKLAKSNNKESYIDINKLGEGWVAEEAIAIAIYCSLKYETDFKKAIIASVNHNGDSDSTGAITGNILGAYLGIESIPANWVETIEHKDTLFKLSKELYNVRGIIK